MGRQSIAAAAIAFVTLHACGGPTASWRPSKNGVSTNRIASTAIEVTDDDVDAIKEAGGTTIGTLTYQSAEYSVQTILNAAADAAAERGGTHYTLRDWRGRDGDSTYTATPTPFGGGYVVREHKQRVVTVSVTVLRLPRAAWRELPDRLVPKDY